MQYSQPQNDDNLKRFCEYLSPGYSPELISVQPPSYAKIGHCYENVEKRIKQKGGLAVYGWEISSCEGIWLEAQFHCIWKSPKGKYTDVTPEHFGRDQVLFLKDTIRVYSGTPIHMERFPIKGFDGEKVQRAWEMQDQILSGDDMLQAQGIDPQSQLGVTLIQSKLLEYQALIVELKDKNDTNASSSR